MYYKILNENNEIQDFITLTNFRFFHPQRKRMFMTTNVSQAQYVIYKGDYYSVSWLPEALELQGKYPKLILNSSTEEEYQEFMLKEKSE